MREHPIPQDIVGYRFHIIGSMTLKQFGELAAGVILALIVYATNLPNLIKWPLIFFLAILGSATAFLPIAGQPLDHWLGAFFKALYKPTKYFWEKSRNLPAPFTYKAGDAANQVEELDLTPMRRERIKEYLATVDPRLRLSAEEQTEQEKIQKILASFKQVEPETIEAVCQQQKPNLKVRPHSLKVSATIDEDKTDSKNESQASDHPTANRQPLPTDRLAKKVEIPQETRVQVRAQNDREEQTDQTTANKEIKSDAAYVDSQTESPATNQKSPAEESRQVLFNNALPFPSQPTEPNKIVGMLLTPNQELIPDAIIEIEDEDGHVLRAVKSNALGQFFVTTPLSDGQYTLRVEHDRYQFPNQELKLNHEIVEPIEIRSLD